MARRATLKIEGLEELSRQLQTLGESPEGDKAEQVLLEGAQTLSTEAERRAPRGQRGNLKEALRTKKLDRRGRKTAPAIAAIDRKKAPHAHLVERGTQERYRRRGRVQIMGISANRGAPTGKMPKQPFFYPAVRSRKNEVARVITTGLQQLIEEAARRG